jgi:hypothetical protein
VCSSDLGTDPWEIAARKPVASAAKSGKAAGSYQAQNKANPSASLQLAAVREVSKPSPRKAVAVQDKRKTAVRKSDPK